MTDTVPLHATVRGTGLPVVLIHGFPFDHTIWDAQIEALSHVCRVIAVDLRGHGQSPVTDGVYTMDLLAADIAARLDDLGVVRAVWIGQSMGGYVTMAALRTLPARVQAVGLVATHPHPDPPEKQQQRLANADHVLTAGADALVEGMLNALFAPSLDRGADPVRHVAAIIRRTAVQGIAGALRGMAGRPDSVPALRAAQVPAVIIAGADDQIVPVDTVRRMSDLLPDAAFHAIAGAGHMVMLEQPATTTAALREFVMQIAAG